MINGVQNTTPDKNLINGPNKRRGGSRSQRSEDHRKYSVSSKKQRTEINQDKVENERLKTKVKLLEAKVAIDDNLKKNFEVVKEQLE